MAIVNTSNPEKAVTPTPKRRRRLFALIALFGSGLMILVLAEIVFRLFVPVTDVPFQFWDPVVGLRRIANQRGLFISGRSVHSHYNFNSQGWNYPKDFSFTRPAGNRRICITGDSYVEALQVDCDKQMAVMMEKRLSKTNRPVECYPFGCSGYGTSQEYQIIHHYILDYKPDVVIIFFTANDVYDCSPYLSPIDPFFALYRLNDADELERMPMKPWDRSGLRRWGAQFALSRYFLVQKRLLEWRRTAGPAGVTLREVSNQASTVKFDGKGMSLEERGRKSWDLIEKLLAAANAECKAAGAALVLVYRGNLPEIDAVENGVSFTPIPRERDPFCLNERVTDMGQDFLAPIAARQKIPYLDLTQPLIAKIRETGRPHNYPDDDHFNEFGHAVAADAMAAFVEPILERSDTAARPSQASVPPVKK